LKIPELEHGFKLDLVDNSLVIGVGLATFKSTLRDRQFYNRFILTAFN
jgi:hypothetical protein